MAPPPSANSSGSAVRATSQSRKSNLWSHEESGGDYGGTEKFPDFDITSGLGLHNGNGRAANGNGYTNGSAHHQHSKSDLWRPRRDSRVKWAPQTAADPSSSSTAFLGHSRQRSLSNALRRMRSGSMRENAQEIAGALRAPISWRLIALCIAWYWSSALTNTSSKSILTAFDKPATLTLVQFALVAVYCFLCSWLASMYPWIRNSVPALKHPIRYPSRDLVMTTLPLAAFQIAGHLLSSTATSKMPVSLVHTIKGLSPLFTVLAYRFIYDIKYPRATYFSLIPLTIGVMLACSGKHSFKGEVVGIICSLLATITFVSSNIFAKRLFNDAANDEQRGQGFRKPDKLNLLCYSSGLAFLLTVPIWLWSEGIGIIGDFLWDGSIDLNAAPNAFDHGRLTVEFLFNGTFHFGQNILAFVILSLVSPVTYSVASLIKRVFVIVIAIIWFRNPTTRLQGLGIALTFLGLYLYDRSSEKNKADQRARTMTESRADQPILPLNVNTKQPMLGVQPGAPIFDSPVSMGQNPLPQAQAQTQSRPYTHGYGLPVGEDTKKSDDTGGRSLNQAATWLPPGTRQEDTWRLGDSQAPTPMAAS